MSSSTISTFELFQMFPDASGVDRMNNDWSIYDIECPDWVTANDDGLWCNFCGELLVASFHADEDTTCPEECRTCGAPDDAERMQEYFS